MQKSTWRYLVTQPAPGAWNMALDEALIYSVGAGKELPTIRLYGWAPPCISLGYSQPASDIDLNLLNQNAWQIVRRPSGGRAILHTDEITYTVVAPLDESRLTGGIIESYRRLSLALVEALKLLGVEAQADHVYELPEGADKKGAICFEVPSNYEITYQNKKLLGSAQVRRKEGVLQHGTLPLNGDLARIVRVLRLSDESQRQVIRAKMLDRAVNLETILQRAVPWETAASAFRTAFQRTLNLELIPADPSAAELEATQKLLQEKYLNNEWTFRI